MAAQKRRKSPVAQIAGESDLRHILVDLGDAKALEILRLSPTVAEVEEAALWVSGEGDRMDRTGHHLVGNVARIFEIVTRDDQDEASPGS